MKLKLFLGVVSSIVAILAFSIVVFAQGDPPSPYTGLQNPFPWDDGAAQATGKGIFESSCLACHGPRGSQVSVTDFSSSSYSNGVVAKPDYYFWVISEGRMDKGMPAYKSSLSETQRWQVLTYIETLGIVTGKAPLPTTTSNISGELLKDCLICHTRVLKSHDKLGAGSAVCLVCHSNTQMKKLRLFDGTEIPASESPKVCAQCHPDKYSAWQKGSHGVVTPGSNNALIKCSDCHNPHQPQIPQTAIGVSTPTTSKLNGKLDCVSCHVKVLTGHDKLGTGSSACWACHSSTDMTTFRLAGNETPLSSSESTTLCGQCHEKRYKAWSEGTHGISGWKLGEPQTAGSERVACVNCHEPHQPQIAFLNITNPHPQPTPTPPPPPLQLLAILGISIVVISGIGIAVTRGEGL